ncbi:MAG: molybdenum cofactor guanylyltransferase [Parvibaculum sp.]|uniref:molybdenum cofactor guanylyltransferase n=1 Tax=Parvibaculum sp. TaxID=2024848 RepID=UPI0032EC8DA2
MNIDGVLIAGGGASRMGGSEKPLELLCGSPLIEHLIDIVRPQVATLALNVKEEAATLYGGTATSGLPLIFDRFGGDAGPLGGVLAGLEWAAARGSAWLATFPADTPFLPRDLVARLAAEAHRGTPVVAVTDRKVQGLCALWPVSCQTVLAEGIEAGRYRSLWWTLDDLGAVRCPFDDTLAFFNVNTKDDLATAEVMARNRDGRA